VIGGWDQLGPDARAIRDEVFVVEQHVSEQEEWDNEDQLSTHAVAYDASGTPVGTERLLPDGYIGRMAVRNGMRGLGIGGCILETLMKNARNAGHREVFLNAQTRVLGFYVAHGYEPQGEEFLDADIPHIRMRCAVSKDDPAL